MAVFFGAGRETWSHGLAVALAGSAIIVSPPKLKLPWLGVAILALLAIVPLVGLLPATWFGEVPAWRRQLVAEWPLRLSNTLSPQPTVTFEAWLTIVCCLVWLASCLGQGFTEAQRRLCLRILMLGGGSMAMMSILEFWDRIDIPWWPRAERRWGLGFGPFANRNHTASLCAITAVLSAAVAHDAFRHKSKWWLPALLTFVSAVAAILINTSRAGLLLFFLGMTLWLGLAAMRPGFVRKTAVAVSLLIAVASVMLVSGGMLSERLRTGLDMSNLAQDFRVLLFKDAARIFMDAPFAGFGIGNFSFVFPQVSSLAQPNLRFLHPESDILWALTEGGLILLLPCLLAIFWLCRVTGPWASARDHGDGRSDRRMRRVAGITAAVGLFHSSVDVPMHGTAYFILFAVLAGLAALPSVFSQLAGPLLRWSFRFLGILVLGMGIVWFAIGADSLDLPLPSAARQWHVQAVRSTQSRQPEAAMNLVERAVELLPLDYGLHHLRAQLRLQLGQPQELALNDFGLARALEPNVANFCFWEGTYWLAYDPTLAVVPWREWIRRSGKSAGALGGGYQQMVEAAEPFPELIATLRQLASTPEMKLAFLIAAKAGPHWQACLEDLLAQDPLVERFDHLQFTYFFGSWIQKGDRRQLMTELENRPAWQVHGWRILTDEYARRGDFKAAYELAEKHQPPKHRPSPPSGLKVDALRRNFLLNPTDPLPGIELYYLLRSKGELEDALYVLKKVAEMPSAPAFLQREWAAIMAEKGEYRRAWELLMGFVDAQKS
jgi:O-antigen ligase/Flp pilus assembly protein TadD